MKPTIAFIKDRFDYFNRLCFSGVLPDIKIIINNSARTLGCFVHPRNKYGHKFISYCEIKISAVMDFPQEVIEDTLIHEMIHYLIWYKGIKDTSTHGEVFKSVMCNINKTHSRNIAITHKSTREQQESDTRLRHHYFCITKWEDDKECITLCARSCIFDIDRLFRNSHRVKSVTWYYSKNTILNKYPRSRTAKAYRITPDELEHIKKDSILCICEGGVFQMKRSVSQ